MWYVCCAGYFYIIKPPEDWVSIIVIWATWFNSMFAVFAAIVFMFMKKIHVSLALLRQIRAALPIHNGIVYVILTICLACIQKYHGYDTTAIVTLCGGAGITIIVLLLHTGTFKTRHTTEDHSKFINLVMKTWERGDFDMVVSFVDQCNSQEIVEIASEIDNRFGSAESKLFIKLIN